MNQGVMRPTVGAIAAAIAISVEAPALPPPPA
jgi:hypothetical protein